MADTIALGAMSRLEGIAAAIGPVDGKTIVDVGCGEGEVAIALASAGATVLGFDPFIVESGWQTAGAGRYRLDEAAADALPLADHTADVVLFVFSLHHVPGGRMGGALAEARRVLKPGGRLCVVEPVAAGPNQHVMELYHDETSVRLDALEALARQARPLFGSEQVLTLNEARNYPDFDSFARQAIAGMRYNGYEEADVLNDTVRDRFANMAAQHGDSFDQPVRINLFA